MSLTSSLFSGVSGLSVLGNSMQIIGDNIANVNTVGFKHSTYTFQDLLSQTVATQSGAAQVGRGAAMGDIASIFEQGSFESTGSTTDLAIGGEGFFVLRETDSDNLYYTRAGNFRFDKDGVLTNPEGKIAQGWALDENGDDTGSITDIVLSSFTSPPSESDRLTVITNLESDSNSNSMVLANGWDGTASSPIDSKSFEYQTTVKVYDTLGSTHDITIYYDKISGSKWEYLIACNPDEDLRGLAAGTSGAGLLAKGTLTFSDSSGQLVDLTMSRFTGRVGNVGISSSSLTVDDVSFEVINADAMAADGRDFQLDWDLTAAGAWAWAGGVTPASYATAAIDPSSTAQEIKIDLDADGEIDLLINLSNSPQTNDTLTFDINDPSNTHIQELTNVLYSGDALDKTSMTIHTPDVLTTDSTGIQVDWDGTNWAWNVAAPIEYPLADLLNSDADALTIDFDGDGSADVTFEFAEPLNAAASVAFNIQGSTAWTSQNYTNPNGYYEFVADFLGGENTAMDIEFDVGTRDTGVQQFVNDSMTTTQYSRASTTTFQTADGYGGGDLQSVDVDVDGVMTGIYSNGQLIPLYRVALAKFLNNQGLYKVGGNLYRETRASGGAMTSPPNTNGLGSIVPNSLEQSNVDIANEFVKMITTQRGYQANSKIITTVDEMLAEVINLKR